MSKLEIKVDIEESGLKFSPEHYLLRQIAEESKTPMNMESVILKYLPLVNIMYDTVSNTYKVGQVSPENTVALSEMVVAASEVLSE